MKGAMPESLNSVYIRGTDLKERGPTALEYFTSQHS